MIVAWILKASRKFVDLTHSLIVNIVAKLGQTLVYCLNAKSSLWKLIYPHSSLTIDKDAIFTSLCGKGNVNMAGLDEELLIKIEIIKTCVDINPCEEELIAKYPVAAFKIWANSKHAENYTIKKFGRNGWLDCSDAFRHTLFNAMNTLDVGVLLAKKFSDTHECGETDNDSVMDIYNNSVGHTIGVTYNNLPIEVIIDRVCDKLAAGQLKILTDAETKDPSAPLISSNGCKCL